MVKLSFDDVFRPSRWPKKMRRAYLLTLPISGPIWLVVSCVTAFSLALACLFVGLPWLIWEEWVKPMWTNGDTTTQETTHD